MPIPRSRIEKRQSPDLSSGVWACPPHWAASHAENTLPRSARGKTHTHKALHTQGMDEVPCGYMPERRTHTSTHGACIRKLFWVGSQDNVNSCFLWERSGSRFLWCRVFKKFSQQHFSMPPGGEPLPPNKVIQYCVHSFASCPESVFQLCLTLGHPGPRAALLVLSL